MLCPSPYTSAFTLYRRLKSSTLEPRARIGPQRLYTPQQRDSASQAQYPLHVEISRHAQASQSGGGGSAFEELLIDPIHPPTPTSSLSPTQTNPLMHQPRVATPSTNKPSSTWTKRKSQRRKRTTKGAAAPSSSSVAGAAIKHKRTVDKFLALRIVYGEGPKS